MHISKIFKGNAEITKKNRLDKHVSKSRLVYLKKTLQKTSCVYALAEKLAHMICPVDVDEHQTQHTATALVICAACR